MRVHVHVCTCVCACMCLVGSRLHTTPEGRKGLLRFWCPVFMPSLSDLCYNGIHYTTGLHFWFKERRVQKRIIKSPCSSSTHRYVPQYAPVSIPSMSSWPPCLKGFGEKQPELKLLPSVNKLCSSKCKPSRKLVQSMHCHGRKVILIEKVKLIKWLFFRYEKKKVVC